MNGKQLAVLLALVGAAAVLLGQHQSTPVSEFDAWKSYHGITFPSLYENAYRERVFLENLAMINLHNANEHKTYELGLNQFSALTQEEFAETYLTLLAPESAKTIESIDDIRMGDIDWTSQGYVTPVKNQGQCGSCWAFSATGGLEGLSKSQGSLQSFSEQQLVDCSGSYGNQACNGGLMTSSFRYVKDKGIVHEDEYPYRAVRQACSKDGGPYQISGYIEGTTCNDLANALNNRPVSVAVDATNWSPYRSGVFNNCGTGLNHGVTLTGATDEYWHVKNSWATSWGESGYIRLARGNTCGICNMWSFPNA